MLRPAEQVRAIHEINGTPPVYSDPVLKNNPRKYAKFIKRCVKIGLVELTLDCEEELGVFFVSKKSGMIRLILDCRKANVRFLNPPSTDLLTAEGLGNIEMDVDGECNLGNASCPVLHLAKADVADCFHRLRLQGDIRKYFCWPGIAAKWLGVTKVGDQNVDPTQVVWPMHCSLGMGFSWATYFAQHCNLARFDKVLCSALEPFGAASQKMADRGEAGYGNLVSSAGGISCTSTTRES
jgi:hypothetical protein